MEARLQLAIELATAAGRVIADRYEGGFSIDTKSSEADLVTEVDLAAEATILAGIRAGFPGDGILAEESGRSEASGDAPRWIVDPLDGTTNFAHGFPYFSVSIAVAWGDEVRVGVVHDPLRRESFCAASGQGAWCQDAAGARRPLSVTTVDRLDRSLVATGFGYDRATAERNNLVEFNRVIPKVRGLRRGGSAALDLANVAAGRLDAYWELALNPWDWAAGWCLVREAGGMTTTLEGQPFSLTAASMCAAGPRLHPVLRDVLVGR
jgi:myo-inositol-1(or 4)-monophosphatase